MKKFTFKRILLYITYIVLFTIICFVLFGIACLYNSNYGKKIDNSFYNSDLISNKNAMVIIPHEDDEINLAGSTIKNLVDTNSNVIVVFATNGDYYKISDIRIKEAIKSLKILGVKEENIIFLGYGDQWDTGYSHIYNAPGDEIVKSHIGISETYCKYNKNDFRTSISGKPSKYTRNNYKKDIKDVILKYKPDTIFCNDLDFHNDHRAVSLLFEESLGEILKENSNYQPIVFKGFAYAGSWTSKDDFYSLNFKSSLKPDKEALNDPKYELDNPTYSWNKRIRFLVSKDTLAYTKRSNYIYRAMLIYKSQKVKANSGRILNSDQVFFERKTNSFSYKSKIEVSSGESKYLNDFKIADSSNISLRNMSFNNCTWIPDTNDQEKSVKIIFDSIKDINSISLYDNISLDDNILKAHLEFSDGSRVDVDNIDKSGKETIINFDTKKNISYVVFKIDQYEGKNAGLNEIEVYKKDNANEKDKFIKLTLDDENKTYIYRYIITNEKEIPLKIYKYPLQDRINNENYRIYIKYYSNDNIFIENNTVYIKDYKKSGEYIVRLESINDPNIYDEIQIVKPTKLEKILLNFEFSTEKALDKLENKFNI